MNNPCDMETVSGKVIDLANPDPSKICINDIAWSLSRLVRYTGHTIQKIPYTVGQHSIFVYERVKYEFSEDTMIDNYETDIVNQVLMHALLHDAAEAYTGDISGPLKKHSELRPIIKKIEEKLDNAIFEGLGLMHPDNLPTELYMKIKMADIWCQSIEAYNFMCSRGLDWHLKANPSLIEYQNFEMPWDNVKVYDKFLETFYNIKKFI